MVRLSKFLSASTWRSSILFLGPRCLRLSSPSRSSVRLITIVIEKFLSCINSFFGKYTHPMIPCNHNDLQDNGSAWAWNKKWQKKLSGTLDDIDKQYEKSTRQQGLSYTQPSKVYLGIAIRLGRMVGKLQFVTLSESIKNKLKMTKSRN